MPLVPHRDIVWDGGVLNVTSAQYDDLAVSDDANFYDLSTFSGTTITGIVPTHMGRPLWLHNPNSATVTLAHEDSSSSAANRFLCPNGQDLVIGEGEGAMIAYSETDARWSVWPTNPCKHADNFGTTFPSTPYDGQEFYRTDLYEEFRYDSSNSLWVGQRTHTFNFGQAGGLSTGTTHLRGAGNAAYGGTDRGYQLPGDWDEARLLNFNAAWDGSNTCTFQIRRNNSNERSIVVGVAAETAEDNDFFEQFTSDGRLQVTVTFNSGSMANVSAWVTAVRVFTVGN